MSLLRQPNSEYEGSITVTHYLLSLHLMGSINDYTGLKSYSGVWLTCRVINKRGVLVFLQLLMTNHDGTGISFVV